MGPLYHLKLKNGRRGAIYCRSAQGPDDLIYLLTRDSRGRILRLEPAG
jgi:hypothetical protein